MACQFDPFWMTLQEPRAVRRSGVVASADLLPLDTTVIPEKRAPQLGAPKKSPSVQLGADVMSRRELESLGSGEATAPRKRGPGAFDPSDCTTWTRQKLLLHQRWEDGTLDFAEHASVDQVQHRAWQRYQRAGGLDQGVQVMAAKASGTNRKREAAAAAVFAEASVSEMMRNPSQHYVLLNSKLLLAV